MNVVPRIEVHNDPAGALDAWAALEAACPASVYQTRRWLLPWIETVCPAAGIRPMLVVARDEAGAPLALLPFGVQTIGGLRLAQFLGGSDSNANLGLFRPGFEPPRNILTAMLMRAAQASGMRPDAYVLANQPLDREGVRNPMAAFPRQESASFSYAATLQPDFDALFHARLSADARKKLRSKWRKLEESGPVAYRQARTPGEIEAVLAAYLDQKRARFAQMNIVAETTDDLSLAYLRRACLAPSPSWPGLTRPSTEAGTPDVDGRLKAGHDGNDDGDAPAMELHALYAGERIVAVYGGGVHRRRFHGMINSFDMDPAIARASPGDQLLQKLVEAKCRDGLTRFDLGIGEGRYKNVWCDEPEPLFDTLIGLSAAGQAFVLMEKARRRAKRAIKQSAWAWPMAKRLRARLGAFARPSWPGLTRPPTKANADETKGVDARLKAGHDG